MSGLEKLRPGCGYEAAAPSASPWLSTELGQSTRTRHRQLEETSFGKKWSEGSLSETEYVMYLADLHLIYSELERMLDLQQNIPCLKALHIPGLFRTEALLKDMEYFNVPFGVAGKAAREYQKRLWVIGHTEPQRLIAHIWVRYMGDLFGGQIAKGNVEEQWPEGVEFYTYERLQADYDLPQPARFVRKFRNLINAVDLNDAGREAVVQEAVWAFDQHRKMFEELSAPSLGRRVCAFAVPILLKYNPVKSIGHFIEGFEYYQG